jgi:hypothetical protein
LNLNGRIKMVRDMIIELHDKKGLSYRAIAKLVSDDAIKIGKTKGITGQALLNIVNKNGGTSYERAIEKTYRRLCK